MTASSWSSSRCMTCGLQGYRKPAPECFTIAAETLRVPLQSLILIDDRAANVEAAQAAGLQGIHFQGAAQLSNQLQALDLTF